MKIDKVESISHLNSSVQLLDLEKGKDLLSDPEESEWRKWEPETEKPKETEATIISTKVAESTAACYFQPGDKKPKTNIQKSKAVTESGLARSNLLAKQKLPVKKEIIKHGSAPSPKLAFNCGPAPKVCNPQSFKKLLQNPNLEVQLVQPGRSPQIVRLASKSSIPSEGGGKYKNGNGALPQAAVKTSGVQVTKLNHPPQSSKLIPVQPPKLIAESLRQTQKLTKSLGRDPPQLLRETNFPNPNIAGGVMRGRATTAAPTPAAPARGRGRAVPIPSKPSPEKLAAQLLEQNKLMLDKKQGTYKGRGRPPKTAPKLARGGGAAANAGAIGRQNQDDGEEGTYVAPKPPPGSNPSNGKDLPPPKGLPPQRMPTKTPGKPVTPKEKTAPPPKGQGAPAAAPPVKATPTKSKVVPFPSKQPQPPPTKNASTTLTTPSGNAGAAVKGQAKAPAVKVAIGKGAETKSAASGGGGTRPAPFLTRVTESSETGEKAEIVSGAGASYKCPDMDAKAFYYDKGVKFWVCLVCNKEEPEISTTPMICCDSCDDWYHFTCVGIDDEPSDDEPWYCKRCIIRKKEDKKQGGNPVKTKPKTAVKTKAKQSLPPPKPPKNPRKV